MYASPTLAVRALAAGGATGYLFKDRVTGRPGPRRRRPDGSPGGTVVDPEVVSLLSGIRRPDTARGAERREREVLQLMAEGRSNHGIAEQRNMSREDGGHARRAT